MENLQSMNNKLDLLIVKKEKAFESRYVNQSDSIIWENSFSPDMPSNIRNFVNQNNKILTTEFKIGSANSNLQKNLSRNYENLKTNSVSSGIEQMSIPSVPDEPVCLNSSNSIKKEKLVVDYNRMLELADQAHSIPNLASVCLPNSLTNRNCQMK